MAQSAGFYTAPQVADALGLPYPLVYKATRTGLLPSRLHLSKYECDPADPCHLEPNTYGQHTAIRQADAKRWLALRNEHAAVTISRSVEWQAGYNAARQEVQSLHDQAVEDDDGQLPYLVGAWLAQSD